MTESDVSSSPGGTGRLAGRPVARIGFGAMQLGLQNMGSRRLGRDEALAVLRQAVEAGVNHIDTAHFYGPANDFIRDALAPYPDELVLVSKVGAVRDAAGPIVAAQRPEQLREQVEDNLATLGASQLGVVNLRRLDAPPGLIAEAGQKADLDDQLAWLLAHYDGTLLIAGTANPAHLAENIAAGNLRLPAAIMTTLDSLA